MSDWPFVSLQGISVLRGNFLGNFTVLYVLYPLGDSSLLA